MRLRWLEVQDFRNHERTSLEVPPGVVALVGANAQGKTNLLEAAIYLLTLRTPRAASDEPLVRKGAESAFLRGEVETTAGTVLLEVEVRATGANRIRVNHAPVRRRRDVRREVRGVMFLPEDAAVVQGEPEERRRFMDEAVESLWPAEETARRAYERALRQRNRLLKEHEPPAPPPDLEAWDAELVRHGTRVTHTRGEMVSRLGPRASEEYEAVAGDRLHVRYAPSVEGEDLERAFLDRLRARRDDELVRRRTLVGPHRDELELGVGDLSARRFASHGETWAAALCLRFGFAGSVEEETREPPVLLLDDPFSGLDPVRRHRVGGRLEGRGQVVVAVPDEAHIPEGAAVFEVAEGRVRPR